MPLLLSILYLAMRKNLLQFIRRQCGFLSQIRIFLYMLTDICTCKSGEFVAAAQHSTQNTKGFDCQFPAVGLQILI